MTDLHALANAISTTSPNVRAFAQAVADVLQPASTVDSSGLFYTGTRSINPHWFEPIPATAKISPNSAALIAHWTPMGAPVIPLKQWCVPIYQASASDAKHDVTVTVYPPAAGTILKGVTIPAGATPAAGGDAHMVTLLGACRWEFWKAVKAADGSWSAGAATAGASPSTGGYSNAGCRASGVPLPLGMIRPEEIQAGVITHALGFSCDTQGAKVLLPSAGGGAFFSGGSDATTLAVPCGARMRLDPTFDVASMPAGPERVIAKALQVYGAFMIDGGRGQIGFGATGPQGWDATGVTTLGNYWNGYLYMVDMPVSRLQVLDYSAAVVSPSQRDELNPCSVWGKA